MAKGLKTVGVVISLIAFLSIAYANTCPTGTEIKPEGSYIYAWNVTSPDADLRDAQIGKASGAIYFMGWIRNNNTCSTTKQNADGTIQWSQNYYTHYVQWKSFVVDNSETYLYTMDVNNPSNHLEIMQQSASTGVIVKFVTL